MKRAHIFLFCLLSGTFAVGTGRTSKVLSAQSSGSAENRADQGEERQRRGGRDGPRYAVPAEAAAQQQLNIVLGRPTDRSIAVSVLSATEVEVRLEYGTKPAAYTEKTESQTAKAGFPLKFEITGLKPNTRYYYLLLTRQPRTRDYRPRSEGTFHTQRSAGSTFTFAVQGDSHPEREGKMYDPVLYAQTMRRVAKAPPDFYLTMGDDFSLDRLIERQALSQSAVNQFYAHQRNFLGVIGCSSPLFLVNGNHEHADLALLDGTENNAAVMAGRARTLFYPLPVPDGFYTGDAEEVKFVGLPRDYYAWQWGDALFIVIDLYWHSPTPTARQPGSARGLSAEERGNSQADSKGSGGRKGGGKGGKGKGGEGGSKSGGERNPGGRSEPWAATLGEAQYRWFAKTLSESKARWKFVFCHHVLGTGRGGIEMAHRYEWGGEDRDGQYTFPQKRPGWTLPIHQLMVNSGVTIFFQGHDHIFCRQQLDGVVYQSCPNPADSTYQAFNREAYRSGDVLPNCGHLRITVAPQKVGVDYIRSYLPKDATSEHPDGELAFHYEIPAKKS